MWFADRRRKFLEIANRSADPDMRDPESQLHCAEHEESVGLTPAAFRALEQRFVEAYAPVPETAG